MDKPTVEETTEVIEEEEPEGAETPEIIEEEEPEGTEIPEPSEAEPSEEMVPKSVLDKMQHRFEKRIGHETAKNKELKHAIEIYGVPIDAKPSRPRQSQFQDEYGEVNEDTFAEALESYDDKLLDWKDSQRKKTESEKQTEVEVVQKLEEFHKAAEPLKAKYSDFDEVLNNTTFGEELAQVLLEDQLPDIAYYLAKNQNEAARLGQIAAASPLQLMRELGKLETKVASMSKGTSNAPPPISPVEGKGDSAVDESKLSDDEWYKRERAKELRDLKKKLE